MKTYRIAGADYQPRDYDIAEMVPIMYAIFRSAVQSQNGALETGITTESFAALIGAIISRLPALKTNRDKRVMGHIVAERIMDYVRRFDDDAARTGEHILDVIGAGPNVPANATVQ